MVRILRAVTPRTFSARLARSRWKHSSPSADEESNGGGPSPPRIFEIVREQQPYPVRGRETPLNPLPSVLRLIGSRLTLLAQTSLSLVTIFYVNTSLDARTKRREWFLQRKKTSGRAAGERLAWENTTLEKKLDRFFAQSELHKVMQSAFFLPFL